MNGKWITCKEYVEVPKFEKTFELKALPKKAEIDITALGYFTLLINGKKVSDELFTPAQTDYAPRDLSKFKLAIGVNEGTHRVLYLTYNVLEYLKIGENKIEVIVGPGYWRQKLRIAEGFVSYADDLLCCFDLKLDDKIISTDGTEKAYHYPILRSNMFYGENFDMRKFDAPLKEAEVKLSDFVPELLEKQDCDSDRVVRTIKPLRIAREGKYLFDCKENITGWAVIKARGKKGDEISVEFAEEIEDGKLNHRTYSPPWCVSPTGEQQIQKDCFILAEGTNELKPMFVYHGFRFFEIFAPSSVIIEDITIEVIHTDLKVTSEFSSDNEVLNWLYDAFIRTQLNNTHGCIPSDCPTRERLGYTGDGQLCTPPTLKIFDAKRFYKKWMTDIFDCADPITGRIQHTAPFMGGGGGHGGWGSAIIFVPYYCYQQYADESFLRDAYPYMKKWIKYLEGHCIDYILTTTEEGMWNLGDWCTPGGTHLAKAYVNSVCMVKQLQRLIKIAEILGEDDGEYYAELEQKCKQAIYEKYFDEDHYCYAAEGADAFAIWANLPKSETLIENVANFYNSLGHFNTGIIGTYVLCDVLFHHPEHRKLAIKLMANDYPDHSYGGMMHRNQTTLGEYFHEGASHDHPMFGSVVAFLFSGLLGIRIVPDRKIPIVINPCLDSIVKKASGSVMTENGKVSVSFEVGDKTIIDITVPEGRLAELRYGVAGYTLKSGHNHFEF